MKYISELTNKIYDTIEECEKADKALLAERAAAEEKRKAREAEKQTRQKEVEQAYTDLAAARKHYDELRDAFLKDYGTLHMSFNKTGKNIDDATFWSLSSFCH